MFKNDGTVGSEVYSTPVNMSFPETGKSLNIKKAASKTLLISTLVLEYKRLQ